MTKKIRTAVFPVGGLGTRFLPATKSIPKEMLPVVDKPLIQYAFELAYNAGVENFIFITGRNKNVISNHFDHVYELQKVLTDKEKSHLLSLTKDWLPPAGHIAFIRQQQPLGLGHSIYCARKFVGDEPFLVLLADEMFLCEEPLIENMIAAYNTYGGNILGVADCAREDVSKYGIIDPVSDDGSREVQAKGMVEKPSPEDAPSHISITGQYILQPEIFSYLEKSKIGAGNEIQLTDSINQMAADGTPTYGVRFKGGRFDCGSKVGFLEANIAFALDREDMREGVEKIITHYADKIKKA